MPTDMPPLDKAMEDPAGVFEMPEAVADHPELTATQKIMVLRRWQAQIEDLDKKARKAAEAMPDAAEAPAADTPTAAQNGNAGTDAPNKELKRVVTTLNRLGARG